MRSQSAPQPVTAISVTSLPSSRSRMRRATWRRRKRQRHDEFAALAAAAAPHDHVASMHLREPLGQRQSEPEAAARLLWGPVHLGKHVEDRGISTAFADRRERIAQLVRERPEKLALRAIRLREQVVCAAQRLLVPLALGDVGTFDQSAATAGR
jgi:hypothetical protein